MSFFSIRRHKSQPVAASGGATSGSAPAPSPTLSDDERQGRGRSTRSSWGLSRSRSRSKPRSREPSAEGMRADTDPESEGEGARPMPHVQPANAYFDSDDESDADSEAGSWDDHGSGAYDDDEDFEIDEELEKNTEVSPAATTTLSTESSFCGAVLLPVTGECFGYNPLRFDPVRRPDNGLSGRRPEPPSADRPDGILLRILESPADDDNRLVCDYHSEWAAPRQPADGSTRPAEIHARRPLEPAPARAAHVPPGVRKEPLHGHSHARGPRPRDRRGRGEEAPKAVRRRERSQ